LSFPANSNERLLVRPKFVGVASLRVHGIDLDFWRNKSRNLLATQILVLQPIAQRIHPDRKTLPKNPTLYYCFKSFPVVAKVVKASRGTSPRLTDCPGWAQLIHRRPNGNNLSAAHLSRTSLNAPTSTIHASKIPNKPIRYLRVRLTPKEDKFEARTKVRPSAQERVRRARPQSDLPPQSSRRVQQQ